MDERMNVKVSKSIKSTLKDLKSTLKVKNESEVIGYLYAIYEGHYPKVTMPEHENALKRMRDLHDQASL